METLTDYVMGGDPELGVFDSDGKPVPVTGMLGGTKEVPIKCVGGAYQEDNTNAEINPCPTMQSSTLAYRTHLLREVVDSVLAVVGLHTKVTPWVEFPENYTFPREAMEAGCSEDWNVYTQKPNPPPILRNGRSCGGHVTVQLPQKAANGKFIRLCDRTLGMYGVMHDSDNRRRELYGKAGSFRWHPVSASSTVIEYRTMSNFWLATVDMTTTVYEVLSANAKMCSRCPTHTPMIDGRQNKHIITRPDNTVDKIFALAADEEVEEVINNSDVVGATKLFNQALGVMYG